MDNNTGFYVFAVIAVVIGALLFKRVVTCMMRSVVILVLAAVLALAYYFFIGQYDPEVEQAVKDALEKGQQKMEQMK